MSSKPPTAKVQTSKSTTADPTATSKPTQTNTALLEEDDEFEDFPVEDWTAEESELPSNSAGAGTTHLWEESWDDDDENEDFSKQLREELKKVEGNK